MTLGGDTVAAAAGGPSQAQDDPLIVGARRTITGRRATEEAGIVGTGGNGDPIAGRDVRFIPVGELQRRQVERGDAG